MEIGRDLLAKLEQMSKKFLIIGIVSGLLSAYGYIKAHDHFAVSYLTSYMFWFGLTVGCFPIALLHCLTHGNWGYAIRKVMQAGLKCLPLMLLAFIPIYFSMHELYEWTHADVVAHDPILMEKARYLNMPGFIARFAIYFIVWIVLAAFLTRWSDKWDGVDGSLYDRKLQGLAGAGLVIYALTITFSALDWVMSTEPHWFSTIYGVHFMIGNGIMGLALSIIVLATFQEDSGFMKVVDKVRSHELGTLLFAFVMLWAYMTVSQLIIIWSGNTQEEAPWYMKRVLGGWNCLAVFIALFHFFVPFFILLIRKNKENLKFIGIMAGFILVMRYFDLFWYIQPAFHETISFHWLDLATFVSIGSLWLAFFTKSIQSNPCMFSHDPILTQQGEHH